MKMKTISVIAFFCSFFLVSQTVSGQKQDDVIKDVVQSIKTTNAKKLAGFFNSTIDLELEDIDGSYSKTQAEIIIRDFFKKSPLKSFTLNHQGSSDDGSKYIIGTYKTTGKEYRVYILLKPQNNKLLIHELQFEND